MQTRLIGIKQLMQGSQGQSTSWVRSGLNGKILAMGKTLAGLSSKRGSWRHSLWVALYSQKSSFFTSILLPFHIVHCEICFVDEPYRPFVPIPQTTNKNMGSQVCSLLFSYRRRSLFLLCKVFKANINGVEIEWVWTKFTN